MTGRMQLAYLGNFLDSSQHRTHGKGEDSGLLTFMYVTISVRVHRQRHNANTGQARQHLPS